MSGSGGGVSLVFQREFALIFRQCSPAASSSRTGAGQVGGCSHVLRARGEERGWFGVYFFNLIFVFVFFHTER